MKVKIFNLSRCLLNRTRRNLLYFRQCFSISIDISQNSVISIFIYTAEMTAIKIAMKEIQKREDTRWVIYTDSLSSMLAIENNRENHPILNQIYDILAEFQNQG